MDIYKFLTQLGIDYQKINHQSVSTVEEAMFINEQIDGVACKNLFLKSESLICSRFRNSVISLLENFSIKPIIPSFFSFSFVNFICLALSGLYI